MFLTFLIVGVLHFTAPQPIATLEQPTLRPIATFQSTPVTSNSYCVQACNSMPLQTGDISPVVLQ